MSIGNFFKIKKHFDTNYIWQINTLLLVYAFFKCTQTKMNRTKKMSPCHKLIGILLCISDVIYTYKIEELFTNTEQCYICICLSNFYLKSGFGINSS